jgi:Xaa-Pro aminopeptidase
MWPTRSPASVFRARRARLASALGPQAAVLCAGRPRVKNFPANTHPFRADSHFLYLVGRSIPDAAVLFADPEPILFAKPPDPDGALWHGPSPTLDELGADLGIKVRPLQELEGSLRAIKGEVASVSPNDDTTAAWLSPLIGKRVKARQGAVLREGSADAALADALITLRLVHDEGAVSQMRQSIAATATAHRAGMRATRQGIREAEVAAAMLGAMMSSGMRPSYEPIVTIHGEVLHAETYDNVIGANDLILADVGAETPEGWAADVTRVWPASGRFSITQRAIYQLVLQAQLAAISMVRPKARYRDIHETAARHILAGLVDLGIFRGELDGLFERGAHTLFFPHGVGHLLGVDVHDMEDLGDRAGYQPGRTRPTRFGDRYLRLDRDLEPGMAVTIEPGFYHVPAILNDRALMEPFENDFDRAELEHFGDVRGIRIEDDVLVTEGEPEVLSGAIPKEMRDIEAVFGFR